MTRDQLHAVVNAVTALAAALVACGAASTGVAGADVHTLRQRRH